MAKVEPQPCADCGAMVPEVSTKDQHHAGCPSWSHHCDECDKLRDERDKLRADLSPLRERLASAVQEMKERAMAASDLENAARIGLLANPYRDGGDDE